MSGDHNIDSKFDEQSSIAKTSELLSAVKVHIQSGDFGEAQNLLESLLKDHPDNSEALYFSAVTQRLIKNYDGALSWLTRLLDIEPYYGRGWQEQGHVYMELNNLSEARRAFQRAVSHNSSLIASWQMLMSLVDPAVDGNAHAHFKDQYQRLASLPPELLGVRNLMEEGKLSKAEQLCRSFLQKQPKHIEAMRLLADLGVKTHVLDDAEFILESALVFDPTNTLVRFDYMNVLYKRQKFELCMEQAQYLLDAEPENKKYRFSYANQCVSVGRFEEALAIYDEFIALDPSASATHLVHGHTLKTIGRTDEAVESYRSVYRAKPDFGDAFWSLANLKTYRFTEDEIGLMKKYQLSEKTSLDDKIHLCFALGKAMEDKKDFVAAGDYYLQGNKIKNGEVKYDKERMSYKMSLQRKFCTAELFNEFGESGCLASDPIFIVGLPRAGSTLLEQILASHSMVDGTLELNNIPAVVHRLNGRRTVYEEPRYPEVLSKLTPEIAQKLGQTYIDETRIHRAKGAYFIDKMPNNFRDIGLIQMILPNAKIIDARRHPMACCFSGFKQLFFEGQEFTYGLDEIGSYYRDYVTLMDHWDTVLPGKVLRVQYEDVVADLDSQVRRILDYCGLPFEESCINFYKNERSVRTPSAEQVRQPIYKSGLDQWHNFDHCLEPLKQALGPVLERYPIE